MGPSNDKIVGKSTALQAIDWLDEHDDIEGYHFKICEPRIDVDSEYHDDLAFYLLAVQQNMTLEIAIRNMCKSMVTTGAEGIQLFVENLTPRSIWGIIPLSEIFRAYWTASFFNKILSEGPHVFSSLADDIMRESRPYLHPTFMVFAFAALAGLHDSYHLMQHFYDLDLGETFNLPDFIKTVLPTVAVVFTFFSQKTSAGESLDEEKIKFNSCIQRFTQSYDEVLGRFGTVEFLRRDLLNEVMNASVQAQNNAIESGIVALGSLWVSISQVSAIVAAGSVSAPLVPLVACGVAFQSAIWAWDSYGKKRELNSQSNKFKAVFSITTITWASAYHIRLALEWFRLHEGEDP
ncbi:general substrate transporter [Fusarium agapanthi]|uniref:General substrate transporter n=1 Tax=Fusarium agapanthi TaxID=1803897 RepID=A0A9P5B0U5_9HYPO|nr:general substrate transporter [Fusarium agapanthi]